MGKSESKTIVENEQAEIQTEKQRGNSDGILKQIIGFRSNKLWKKIIACVFYTFFLLGTIVSVATLNFSSAFLYTFLISLPFAAFYGIDFLRKRNDWKPALISVVVCVAMIAGIGLTYVPPTAEALAVREAAQLQKQGEREAARLERDVKNKRKKRKRKPQRLRGQNRKRLKKQLKKLRNCKNKRKERLPDLNTM